MISLPDRRKMWGITIIYCDHNFQFDNCPEKSVIQLDLVLGYMIVIGYR